MPNPSRIQITLRRSLIGEKPKNRATVASLGLRKINQTVEHRNGPVVQGMLHRVRHLVETKEVENNR